MKIKRNSFYKKFKKRFGRMVYLKSFVTIEKLLGEAERKELTIEQTAYVLATSYHEARHRHKIFKYLFHDFFPIKERGSDAYFIRNYWDNKKVRDWLGNIEESDAVTYCGRGLAQVTGRSHYKRLHIQNNPDMLLDVDYSVKIIIDDMLKGNYTGAKLTSHVNGHKVDYINARRVINGTDKAEKIADYAIKFENILKEAKA